MPPDYGQRPAAIKSALKIWIVWIVLAWFWPVEIQASQHIGTDKEQDTEHQEDAGPRDGATSQCGSPRGRSLPSHGEAWSTPFRWR